MSGIELSVEYKLRGQPSQTGLRCPRCGNSTSLNIRNDRVDNAPDNTIVHCYSYLCGYTDSFEKFIVERV